MYSSWFYLGMDINGIFCNTCGEMSPKLEFLTNDLGTILSRIVFYYGSEQQMQQNIANI